MLQPFEATTSGFKTRIMMGLSTLLVQMTQSLLGSSCARIALILSRSAVSISGCSWSMEMVSLAVVDSSAGRAAEYVYDADEMR